MRCGTCSIPASAASRRFLHFSEALFLWLNDGVASRTGFDPRVHLT
jgi:hypothetical protein